MTSNTDHHQDGHHQGPVDQSALCDTIMDLIPAYSVGATNPEETRLVESMLPLCADARAELVAYQQMTDSILHMVPGTDAPPPVSALLARVRAEEATAAVAYAPPALDDNALDDTALLSADSAPEPRNPYPVVPSASPPNVTPMPTGERPNRGMRALVALAAASVLLFAGITAYSLTRVLDLQQEQGDLLALLAAEQARPDPPTAPTAAPVALNISGTDHFRELTAAETIAEGASARFVWNVEQQVGAVFASNLPPLPEGRVYQLWVVTLDGDALSLGTFAVDAAGEGALVFLAGEPIENFTHIGISVEPEDGSPNPTTPHLVIGTI